MAIRNGESPRQAWNKLTPVQQRLVVGAAAAELTLKIATLVDIQRRPAEQIRGPKWAWRAAMAVNLIGPVSYWTFGRR